MRALFARFLVSALVALLLGATLAVAQGPGGVGPGFNNRGPLMEQQFGRRVVTAGRWWNNPHMIETLKLTDDQRKSMDGILFDHREKLIDLRAALEKAELEMQPLMSASQPDEKAMVTQIDKIVAARAALEKANAMFLLDIRMKLTPDQWKQLQAMRSAMRARGGPGAMRPWQDRGPGAPPPPRPGTQAPAPPPGNSGPAPQ